MSLKIPKNYKSILNTKDVQYAIKLIRDTFQTELETELGLTRVSAPLFVRNSSGLNDNLSGVETPVSFRVNGVDDDIEIVHSLAKWKRAALKKYNFDIEEGFYTNMTAIRKDEDLDNLHSVYVDQWDWEKVIDYGNRNIEKLVAEVAKIFTAIKNLENEVCSKYDEISPHLPDDFEMISTQELLGMWPENTPKERENKICRDKGCVLLTQIGKKLTDGTIHDTRSPDYDDWEMNGDILFWYEPLSCALEISSMGVRVDETSIVRQLEAAGCEDRMQLPYHQAVIKRELPYTVGGGIGQSRLCMLMLQCAHVGEVQSSVWPDSMITKCADNGINLL